MLPLIPDLTELFTDVCIFPLLPYVSSEDRNMLTYLVHPDTGSVLTLITTYSFTYLRKQPEAGTYCHRPEAFSLVIPLISAQKKKKKKQKEGKI